jgi:hypothetical protein
VYVEIGYNITTITESLVNSIISLLTTTDKSVVIIAPNTLRRGAIVELVLEYNIQFEGRIITSYKMLPKSKTYIQFVDNFTLINEKNLIVDETAYYFGVKKKSHKLELKQKTLIDEILDLAKQKNQIKLNNKPKLKIK